MSESALLLARLGLAATGTAAQAAVPVDDAVAAWPSRGLARGRLHEVFAAEAGDGPSGAGFALALAVAARATPILWVRTAAAERHGGRLHAGGLAELGLDAATLLVALVDDEAALLRTAADAARCPGIGTLLVEAWGRSPGIDLTATRRLMLAAEASGVTAVLLRIDAAPVPSAAATRWQVTAAGSTPLDADAPGGPAFNVELLRRRGGPAGQRWCVEWDRDTHCFRQQAAALPSRGAAAPLSGAGLSLVAGGAAARDAPAFVRRAG